MKKYKYKKIFIEDLPKYNSGEFKNCINWQGINNNIIRFEYENISGTFLAKYFDKNTEKILVEYQGREIWCYRSTFRRNNISRIIGVIQSNYRYNINDNYINKEKKANFTIVDRKIYKNKKMYKYICNDCKFDARKDTYYKGKKIDYWVTETNLTAGISCPCCGLKRIFVQKGITDIPTTSPWMVPYFQNGYDEAKLYMDNSTVKKNFICPYCGRLKEQKVAIYSLHSAKSLSCIYCSDGFSYPEKFVACFLEQLKERFITEYSPQWAKGKRYDFYLIDSNFIIEVDGGIGHGKRTYDNKIDLFGKYNDEYKDKIALEDGYLTVIRVPADISNLDYMKKSLLKTFQGIFYMELINWKKCEEYALGSLMIKACKNYSNGNSIKDICNYLHMSEATVKRYLYRGYKIGLCPDWHIKNINKKSR